MIQLAEGIAALLPEAIGLEIFGVTFGRGHGFAAGLGVHRVVAHGDSQVVVAEPAFGRQGGLATATGRRDPLAPFGIGHVASGIDPLLAGFGPAGLGHHVAVGIELELALHKVGVGGVANRVEESPHAEGFDGASRFGAGGIPQAEAAKPVVS